MTIPASTHINLHGTDATPAVRALTDRNQRFLVLDLGPNISIILPGLDAEAADYARALAGWLVAAADGLAMNNEVVAVGQEVR
jgi:hypothetical protein